jgi:hypothetical protein
MAPHLPAIRPRRSWRNLTVTALLLLLGVPVPANAQTAEVVTSPPQPPITIILKGGAGTIKVDRTWTAGTHLCWESRGHRHCTPWRLVSYIRYPH